MKFILDFIEKHKEYIKKILKFSIIFTVYLLLSRDDFNFINTLINSAFGLILLNGGDN